MAVHRREETWLQASDLIAAAGQPISRNMGWRYAEHHGSGRSWSQIDVEHRRLMTGALLFGCASVADTVIHISLNRCRGTEGQTRPTLAFNYLMAVISLETQVSALLQACSGAGDASA